MVVEMHPQITLTPLQVEMHPQITLTPLQVEMHPQLTLMPLQVEMHPQITLMPLQAINPSNPEKMRPARVRGVYRIETLSVSSLTRCLSMKAHVNAAPSTGRHSSQAASTLIETSPMPYNNTAITDTASELLKHDQCDQGHRSYSYSTAMSKAILRDTRYSAIPPTMVDF
ncbi:hypothetical protein U0070_008619 [Myodes glareolus]|uniref:Uncharacterized protein n=1 Tax=Myodes glareolus TaxID=447135 RepID=A0AAW0JGU4_MYOGA